MAERAVSVERLVSDIEWAMAHGLPPSELVPMFRKLLRHAPEQSPEALFAKRQLAELLVQSSPWDAALLARQVLNERNDDRAWAVLGLAHTLLGNYRSAAKAYHQAIALVPGCPWYAHNLGHLMDVAFDQPTQAVRYLRNAYHKVPHEPEIASSYAHALVRSGKAAQARSVLQRALRIDRSAAEALLRQWLTCDPPGSLPSTTATQDGSDDRSRRQRRRAQQRRVT